MTSSLRALATLLLALLAGACYSGTFHMAPLADQSVELSDPSLCRIYVLRPSQGRWNLRRVLVYDGEREIGSIHEDEFLCWERRPGPSQLTVVYDAPAGEGGYAYTLFDVETVAGEVAFFGVALEPDRNEPVVSALDPAVAREDLEHRLPAQPLDTLDRRRR